MIITICCSVNFYRQAVGVQEELEKEGLKIIIPFTAEKMKRSGDYEVSHYKTWHENADDYHKKTKLMRGHFEAVAKADAILVLNYEKHDQPNYIGGNVLMEMGLAFYLKKPIFILNEIPKDSTFLEEIIGMEPEVLHGNLRSITKHLGQTP